ncbi:MAG: MATE family efflux transporter [Caldilineaceae bacterium]
MPYSEHPLLGRARAKMKAERIVNRTRHFNVDATAAPPIRTSTPPPAAASDTRIAASAPLQSRPTSLNRRVFQLAWPVISENFLQTLLGIVDTLMVAQLGAFALAGVGTAIQIMFFVIAALSATSVGSSVLVAQAVGARKLDAASHLAKQSLVWSVLISIPLIGLGIYAAQPLIGMFGMAADVTAIGVDYLRVTLVTVMALTLLLIGGGVLRGVGDSRTPMLVTMLANVINVVLDYGLVFGKLGMPEMGAVGSAWATFISRVIGLALLLWVLWRGREGISIRGAAGWLPQMDAARNILRIGVPAALEQMLISVGFLFMTIVVARLGAEAMAAQRIALNAMSLSFLPGVGFGIAATALVGQSIGARNQAEGKAVGRISTQWALIWMSVLGLVFFVLAEQIMRLFTAEAPVIELGAAGLRIIALTQPFWAISIVQGGALRGTGNTRYPLRVNTAGIWCAVALGTTFITLFGGDLGTIWTGFLITGPVTAFLMWRRFTRSITQEKLVAAV